MKKLLFIYFLGWGWAIAQKPFDPLAMATDLLNSLSDSQKEVVSFALEDPAKTRWHYLPHSSFKREGLPLSDMTPIQVQKTYALLEAYLSESGYDQMEQIIDLENYLAVVENNPAKRDPTKYYLAVYGTPHRDSLWAWSFEGHHVSLNFTVSPDKITFAPAFWGSNPGIVPDGPEKGKIVLRKDHDWGLELIQSLSPKQLIQTLVSSQTYGEILTSNQAAVEFIPKNGISYGQLNRGQKKQLKEIKNSKIFLEKIVNKSIDIFCYPYGGNISYNKNTLKILKTLKFKLASLKTYLIAFLGNLSSCFFLENLSS